MVVIAPEPCVLGPPGLYFSIINKSPAARPNRAFGPRRLSNSAGSGPGTGGFRNGASPKNRCFVKGFLHFTAGFRPGFRRVQTGSTTVHSLKIVVL